MHFNRFQTLWKTGPLPKSHTTNQRSCTHLLQDTSEVNDFWIGKDLTTGQETRSFWKDSNWHHWLFKSYQQKHKAQMNAKLPQNG